MLAGMNRRSNIYRALMKNPGFAVVHDQQRVYARNLEVPPAVGLEQRGLSRTPMASSRREEESSGCARRRWTC